MSEASRGMQRGDIGVEEGGELVAEGASVLSSQHGYGHREGERERRREQSVKKKVTKKKKEKKRRRSAVVK
jgi:transcriptional regulator of NAD metabolism